MRAHFATAPAELTDAARTDGVNTWQLFWRVHVPLARPAISSLAILLFLWTAHLVLSARRGSFPAPGQPPRPGAGGHLHLHREHPRGSLPPVRAPIAPEDGPLGALYAGKLVEARPGDWRFLAFRAGLGNAFIGEVTDPLPAISIRTGTCEPDLDDKAAAVAGGRG